MATQHFVSVSGGKDSLRVALKAIKRFERRPPTNLPLRFQACDTGNEEGGWLDYIHYLERELGIKIEILRADFTEAMAVRRANIRSDWGIEKRCRRHTRECRDRASVMSFKARKALCTCPEMIYPAVPDYLIEEAIALLHPTGNPFLDLCMLKGRFPGAKTRFCTDELKIAPMMAVKQPLLDAGINIVEWIGERAEESPGRAAKPIIQRIRHTSGASQILYRPIHQMLRAEVFESIAEAGLKPNPLYAMGAERVGCWPCIMCGKAEIALIARHSPQDIDRLRSWEKLVALVSRRRNATFFCAKMVPGDPLDETRANIDAAVAWSQTSRGGRQFDAFQVQAMRESRAVSCDRDLVVCE